jgi:hypothetical protein
MDTCSGPTCGFTMDDDRNRIGSARPHREKGSSRHFTHRVPALAEEIGADFRACPR